jgi:mono/diheme cytochrome c family protein
MKKILLVAGGLILAVILGLAGFVLLKKPAQSQPRTTKVPMTPERIARGKYLFHHVSLCVDCHSPRDISKYPLPTDLSKTGHGWIWPAREAGSDFVAPNLTPDPETGLGQWTDGEKLRAIREGISKDGHALFPLMPYTDFRNMSDEDAESIVAYMNSLAPVRVTLPKTKLGFPIRYIVNFIPQPIEGPVPHPNAADRLAYGKYLTTIGTCTFCHTPGENQPDMQRQFAGGREFRLSDKLMVRSSNISPDPETGIGKWSEQRFLNRFAEFREYTQPGANFPPTTPANFTVMHWVSLSGMQEDDLKAIYGYLKTLPAQVNKVEVHPPGASSTAP